MYRILTALLALMLLVSMVPAAAAEDAPDWDLTPLPDAWFDDAVFLGDSVLYNLVQYCERNEEMGDALFFSERSLHVESAVRDFVQILYQGNYYFPLDLIERLEGSKLFILLGINDIGGSGGVDATMEMWASLCEGIRERNPEPQIFLMSCFPMWSGVETNHLNNEIIRTYNERLRDFCAENGCVFVDTAEYFRGEDGGIAERYSSDHYVHINDAAAALWAEQLKNPANYSVDPRSFDHEENA